MSPRPRALALLTALGLLVSSLVAPVAASAAVVTSERVVLPPSGTVTIAGRGYGHGRGLSQWGARAAAAQGVSYPAILDFYYPGTVAVTQSNQPIRVLVSADTDNEVRVVAEAGMTASDTVNGPRPIGFAGQQVTQWRIVRQAPGLYLEGLVNGSWRRWSQGASATYLDLASPDGTLRLILPDGRQKEYRGSLRGVSDGDAPRLRTVNAVPLESYLRSVVPAESPSSWPADALRAQAVAARTYASHQRASAGNAGWQTCDTTQCQVYSGIRTLNASGTVTAVHEAASTDAAISATANQVRHYAGALAFTQFSASNGGWTAAGNLPYQVARRDPWDPIGNPSHAWSVKVSASTLRSAFPQVGTPRSIEVRRRTGDGEWGGRVVEVVVSGASGSTSTTGSGFRSARGLRSDWWKGTGSTALDSDTTTDGRTDLTAVMSDGTLRVYEGNGTGGFAESRQIGNGWSTMRLVVRANDLTGDGRTDLLAVDAAGVMWRYPTTADGAFAPRVRVGSGWGGARTVVAPGDLDGDGNADLLAIDTAGVLWRYRGQGNGGFSARERMGAGWQSMSVVVGGGDWNADGRADFLARDGAGRLYLYRGAGNGFDRTQIGTGWGSMRLLSVVRDWDGDGLPDLVATGADGLLYLYRWTGSGFASRTTIGNGWGVVARLA